MATHYDEITRVLREAEIPLTRKDISYRTLLNDNILGVILNRGVHKGIWLRVKYPKSKSFYALVEWLEIDKHKIKFINPNIEPLLHGIKDQPPGVSNP
jgi:hypothetical protein